jgi:hypothetical protein
MYSRVCVNRRQDSCAIVALLWLVCAGNNCKTLLSLYNVIEGGVPVHRLRQSTVIAAVLLTMIACEPDLSDLNDTPPDLTDLVVPTTAPPADGGSLVLITARARPAATFSPREVQFTTSAGKFLPSLQDTATVRVDTDGQARVQLRAPDVPATAYITARAGNATRVDSLVFGESAALLTDFHVEPKTAPADETRIVDVSVRLPPNARGRFSKVVFKTTLGKFFPANLAETESVVDTEGRAVAFLRAPKEPGRALVSATAGGTVLTDTVRFVAPAPVLLEFNVPPQLEADNESLGLVKVRAAPETPSGSTVILRTTNGRFTNTYAFDTIFVASNREAISALRAPNTPGVATLTATLGSESMHSSVTFVPAYAEFLSLTPSSFQLTGSAGSSITIEAKLTRTIGQVSPGTPVEFNAFMSNGLAIGLFSNAKPSDGEGKVTIAYSPGTTTYEGPIIIEAKTRRRGGDDLVARITVEVKKPED